MEKLPKLGSHSTIPRISSPSFNRTMNSSAYDETGNMHIRSNSSTTLQAGSHENSQPTESNCQRRVDFHSDHITGGDRDKSVYGKPSTIEQNKSTNVASNNDNIAFAELNLRARRYLITYSSNTHAEEPVREVFPKSIRRVIVPKLLFSFVRRSEMPSMRNPFSERVASDSTTIASEQWHTHHFQSLSVAEHALITIITTCNFKDIADIEMGDVAFPKKWWKRLHFHFHTSSLLIQP